MMTPIRKVNKAEFLTHPGRFELRSGNTEGAPLCPYGNHYEWIGYDLKKNEYLRFTKSVFKLLVAEKR